MAQILEFKQKYIILSAVCNTCELTWYAEMLESDYIKFLNKGKKGICPHCGHTEIGLARDL